MNRKFLFVYSLISVTTLVLAACSGGGSSNPTSTPKGTTAPSGSSTGSAVFAVRDAAANMGAVTAVQVAIDGVRVHQQGGAWTTVSTQSKTFSLLDLRNKGIAELLAQANLQAGSYDQMELTVSSVLVTDDKGQHEAKLPSGKLQLKGTLEVRANATSTAAFDFQADRSLHMTGEGQYILAPVIRVETRADADVQVDANRQVKVGGGRVTTESEAGMNADGDVDAGLRISPDAVLHVVANGRLIQTGGHAVAVGTIKAVDKGNSTITVATRGGGELVLQVATDSNLKIGGSETTEAEIESQIGAEVMVQYNAETKTVTRLVAGSDAKARAEAGTVLDIRGVIKSVDQTKGTVTIVADSGAPVVIQVASDGDVKVGGVKSGISGLGAKIGSRIETKFDASRGAASSLDAKDESSVTATGQLKAVDTSKGIITLANQAGQETTLFLDSGSRVMVNGSLATLGQLKSTLGSEVTVEFGQRSKTVAQMNARGVARQAATVTGVIKVSNPAQGTITIVTRGGNEITLNITAASSIVADGSISSPASLKGKEGSPVTIDYDAQTNTAMSIKTQAQPNAQSSGTIKMVDTATGSITIAVDGGGDLTLKITPDTRINVQGNASTLADLQSKIGSKVALDYSADVKTVANADVRGQADTTVAGTLKSVDMAAGTLTIAANTGGDVALKIVADSQLRVGSTASTLAGLTAKIGSEVMAQYDSQTKALVRFQAGAGAQGKATITGTLKSVDMTKGVITIVAEGGQDTVLQTSGAAAQSLTDLQAKVGTQVTAEYNPDSRTAGSITAAVQGQASGSTSVSSGASAGSSGRATGSQPDSSSTSGRATGTASVSGTLKMVNVIAGTITIAAGGGQEVVLKVPADAKVAVNGSASTIAALVAQVGARVTAEYNVETKTAVSVSATGQAGGSANKIVGY